MKNFLKISALSIMMVFMVNCSGSDDDTSVSGSDPIIGKWKTIAETENGIPEVLTACELLDRTEFKAGGALVNESYESQAGNCVLEPNNGLPAGFTSTWQKISANSYKYVISGPGIPAPVDVVFTAVFSNNNNTVTTTFIEDAGTSDETIQIAVNERVN